MKYFYKKPTNYLPLFGETYRCRHQLYSYCTLYRYRHKGLAVIQQHFDPKLKSVRWAELDPWLANDLYLAPGFYNILRECSDYPVDGLYPTMEVRKLMWLIKMKPLPREFWEEPLKEEKICKDIPKFKK